MKIPERKIAKKKAEEVRMNSLSGIVFYHSGRRN